jgi:poly-D-alanine transfer protein DltD
LEKNREGGIKMKISAQMANEIANNANKNNLLDFKNGVYKQIELTSKVGFYTINEKIDNNIELVDIEEFLEELKALGYDVMLNVNGRLISVTWRFPG